MSPAQRSAAMAASPAAARPPARCHAQEIDLRAFRAVLRAAAEGRREGHEQALREAERVHASRARRARIVLAFSVLTALFVGLSVGVLVGAFAPPSGLLAGERAARE